MTILSLEFEPGQQVSDQVDPGQRFVVSLDDRPRCDHRVGACQHFVARIQPDWRPGGYSAKSG